MKIATLYRKDGKVILETDNDAIAQVATDTPQDVVVEQDVSPQGIAALDEERNMTNINEVRGRLALAITSGNAIPVRRASVDAADMRTILDDHARLQEDAERLDWLERFVRKAYIYGASFDYAQALEGERGGYRFMARHRLDARHPTLRAAIDAAKGVQP